MPRNRIDTMNTALESRSRDGVYMLVFDKLVVLAMTLFLLVLTQQFSHAASATLMWGCLLTISFGFGHLAVNAISILSEVLLPETHPDGQPHPIPAK